MRSPFAQFLAWVDALPPALRDPIEDAAKRDEQSLRVKLERDDGVNTDFWLGFLRSLPCNLEYRDQAQAGVSVANWLLANLELSVVERHFLLIAARHCSGRMGDWIEALPRAREDLRLTPELLRADPEFDRNREDALLDLLGYASRLDKIEEMAAALIWSVVSGVVSPARGKEIAAEQFDTLVAEGTDQAVSDFVHRMVGGGVLTQAEANGLQDS